MAQVTSSQTVGPFFHRAMAEAGGNNLVQPQTRGERIVIEGHVLDGDGAPVPDALIEIWQANSEGRYDHREDTQERLLDSTFQGFGRSGTDDKGAFRFTTIKPGAVPGRGEKLQAPHINVVVFARGLLTHLYTRIYFPGEPLNASDAFLCAVPEARRQTLIAKVKEAAPERLYHFDIVLQGDNETVFFDI